MWSPAPQPKDDDDELLKKHGWAVIRARALNRDNTVPVNCLPLSYHRHLNVYGLTLHIIIYPQVNCLHTFRCSQSKQATHVLNVKVVVTATVTNKYWFKNHRL